LNWLRSKIIVVTNQSWVMCYCPPIPLAYSYVQLITVFFLSLSSGGHSMSVKNLSHSLSQLMSPLLTLTDIYPWAPSLSVYCNHHPHLLSSRQCLLKVVEIWSVLPVFHRCRFLVWSGLALIWPKHRRLCFTSLDCTEQYSSAQYSTEQTVK
jgi:hypothetical protein